MVKNYKETGLGITIMPKPKGYLLGIVPVLCGYVAKRVGISSKAGNIGRS
jgi:hypothetical protein